MPNLISKRFLLRGKVQGVGCRFQVQDVVEKVGHLAGWVQNLPDGRVEVCLKGPPLRLNAAEKIFRTEMIEPVRIAGVDVEALPEDFSVAGFRIKR